MLSPRRPGVINVFTFTEPGKESLTHRLTWLMGLFFCFFFWFCFIIGRKNSKWGCLSPLTCITGGSNTCCNTVFNVTDITWGSAHRLCVFVCVCASTHWMKKMASCFPYLHGCRIIEAPQEKKKKKRKKEAGWQQVADAEMSTNSAYRHTRCVWTVCMGRFVNPFSGNRKNMIRLLTQLVCRARFLSLQHSLFVVHFPPLLSVAEHFP